MTFFESAGDQGYGPPPRRSRRAGRVLFAVSILFAVAFVASMVVGALPASVRLWVAESVPAGRVLVGIPEPGAEAVELADLLQLTDEGRAVFFASAPYVADAAEIAQACSDGQELPDDFYHAGCYLGLDRIYILREAARSAMVTTAAHELLHAAYARLDDGERAQVDALASLEVERIPADDPVHGQIAASTGGDEAAWGTEAFAYVGSQVAGPLSPQLEAVYDRYFADRGAVAEQYRSG